jgi:hypothetical protein
MKAITPEKILDISDIKEIYKEFYVAAVWVSDRKSTFTRDEFKTAITGINHYTETNNNLKLLWDNLFYQMVNQNSFYVKEAIIQMLLLNHIMKHTKGILDEEIDDLLLILRNARVVLPLELFDESNMNSLPLAMRKNIVSKSSTAAKALKNAVQITKAISTVTDYQDAIKQLQKLKKNYFKAKQTAYDVAKREHDLIAKPLIKKFEEDYHQAKRDMCQIPRDENYDPSDFCNQPHVLFPAIPEFVFEFADTEISYLNTKLSENALELLNSVLNIGEIETFQEAIDTLEAAANMQSKMVFSKNKFSRKVMAIGDVVVPLERGGSRNNFAPSSICSYPKAVGTKKIYFFSLLIAVPDSSFEIETISVTLEFNDGSATKTDTTDTGYAVDNVINTNLFFGNTIELAQYNTISQISGRITFSNGVVKIFNANSFRDHSCIDIQLNDKVNNATNEKNALGFNLEGFGYRPLGIADYKKVVQEICCYDAGEVAHIENVMATEFKERTTEKTYTKETTEFESQDIEKESLSDTTTAQRFEMQTEVAKIIQEQRQTEGHLNVTAHYGNVTLDAGASFANSTSKEQSNRQAVTQAKDITQRAMERIVSRIKTEKTVKITESFKEINSHIYDNRAPDSTHVSGVYRFINAIYKNQVFNYGKRMMYEFMIPEPSRLHHLGKTLSEQESLILIDEPIDPRTLIDIGTNNQLDFTDINVSNYQILAAQYNASVEVFPEALKIISKAFVDGGDPAKNQYKFLAEQLEIPEGYETFEADIESYDYYQNLLPTSYCVTVGNFLFNKSTTNTSNPQKQSFISQPIKPYRNKLPVSYQAINRLAFNVVVTVKCRLTAEAILKWQKETFEAIMSGYQEQLRIYNDKVAEVKQKAAMILDSNPLFYRQTEQLVLRRNCISYLIDPDLFGQNMYNGDNANTTNADDITFQNGHIIPSKEMDDYTSLAKFIEQAFEWNIMSYSFYPYYWGSKNEWSKLYQFESNDALFRSFMQAGMARVVVTVKPGFEDAVMHFMAFRQIWNGGQMPVLGDPLYLSIVDELREQEYKIEETWETVLPTNLIALQSSGVALEGETGLPCSPDCKEATENNPFSRGEVKLKGVTVTPA